MILFVGNDGTVTKGVPSSVYQGAANSNDIYLIAPFAENLQASVTFKLPNGVIVPAAPMTQLNAIPNVINKDTGMPYAGWSYTLPSKITKYYGTVTAQFAFYGTGSSVITTTSSVSFTVGKGVPSMLPDAPSEDVYDKILGKINKIISSLDSGAYTARSLFAYNAANVYNANEIVFYPYKGTYGVFIKALRDNTVAPPYDGDGNLDTTAWQLEVDFNILTELYTLKDDIETSVNEAKTYATNAAKSADESGNSANSAQQSALSAEQSAEKIKATEIKLDGLLDGTLPAQKAVSDETGENIATQFATVNSDIEGLREDITNEAHFRGYLETNAEIQALSGTPNDYAYSAESGTVWIYQTATGWTNSGKPVPDQTTPPSNSTPLMDGKTASAGTSNEYARGDHRHPSDTTKLDKSGGTISGGLAVGYFSCGGEATVGGTLSVSKEITVGGTLSVSGEITENGKRVYSPDNPPPSAGGGVNPFDYLITTQEELDSFITALYAMSSAEHLNVAIVEKDSDYILNSPLDFRRSSGPVANHIEIIGIGNPILRVDETDGTWNQNFGCFEFLRNYKSYTEASGQIGLYETKIKNITVRIGEYVKSGLAGFFAETPGDDFSYGGTDLFSVENCRVIINNIDRESYGFEGCANLVDCHVVFLSPTNDSQVALESRPMFSYCYNLTDCSVINIVNGFDNCINLLNCKVDAHSISDITASSSSYGFTTFFYCENITNCIVNFNNSNYNGSSQIMIFDHCQNVSNCRFLGESMNINENNGFYIFSDCEVLSNCSCYLQNMGTSPSAVYFNCSYCSSCKVSGSTTLIWDGTTVKRDDSSCDIDE